MALTGLTGFLGSLFPPLAAVNMVKFSQDWMKNIDSGMSWFDSTSAAERGLQPEDYKSLFPLPGQEFKEGTMNLAVTAAIIGGIYLLYKFG